MKRWLLLFSLIWLQFPALATTVRFETNLGHFDLTLDTDKAPKTCENFLRYVKDGSYQGSIFHRVIQNFVIQGGGFLANGERLPNYPSVVNESNNGLSNVTGTIAMARTSDPDSATRQFYINVHDNPFLDGSSQKPGYTVFGKVTQGMDTIEKIATQPTGNDNNLGMPDVPQTQIVIQKVMLVADPQ
ncbi:peptidylprolyl isomerase [Celerinatantimonas sp. YJH-8]|uniref:peptidylprolyl isomerase n=1 Tax=Celerinatantimonas sp. YJH-8 TaxID=3228714 RepID=UPI0038C08CAB